VRAALVRHRRHAGPDDLALRLRRADGSRWRVVPCVSAGGALVNAALDSMALVRADVVRAPVITLNALRLAKELLLPARAEMVTGARLAGTDDKWGVHGADVIVGLTRRTVILAPWAAGGLHDAPRLSDRTTSYDLVTGRSRPRNGVECCIYPGHLALLQALLGVEVPS
jgi:hypothetical protein